MTKNHEKFQSVKHINGMNHPVIMLFTNQQINAIKRFCSREDAGFLGMDKTYNLGKFHVTPTVYKDIRLKDERVLKTIPSALDQRSYTRALQLKHTNHSCMI